MLVSGGNVIYLKGGIFFPKNAAIFGQKGHISLFTSQKV